MLSDKLDTKLSRNTHLLNLLLWEGWISRRRLIELHGLSPVRASEWIRELREQHPSWMRWDARAKAFFATDAAYRAASVHPVKRGALPVHVRPYVADWVAAADPGVDSDDALVTVMPWDFSSPQPKVFAAIRMAIEFGQMLRFMYRSMGAPEPHLRSVWPHSLIQAGRRWHVRGYCMEREDFRDFTLGRISDLLRITDPGNAYPAQPPQTVADDVSWVQVVPVSLVAHPLLSAAQQEVVRQEFFSGTSGRVEKVRGALLPYFVQEVRAAVDPAKQKPPEFQIAIDNIEDCKRWIFPR